MTRQGLTREFVIATAIQLIEEKGFVNFSLKALAAALNIKPASLYNHFQNINEVVIAVGIKVVYELRNRLMLAIEGKQRQQAILDLADAYREFALQKPELYKAMISLTLIGNEHVIDILPVLDEPHIKVVSMYDIGTEQKVHWQRVLRANLTGFMVKEIVDFFSAKYAPPQESYRLAIRSIIASLESLEAERILRAKILQGGEK